MLKAEGSHRGEREKRTRQRASTSCTECKRRKQKCNQVRDRPCNNCQRRYPPVECIYTDLKKSSKQDPNLEILLELEDDEPRWGETQATSAVGAPAPPNVQHAHGFTRVGTKNYLDGTRELGILKRDGATGHASEDISHIFRIDPDTLYHPYAENSKYSHCTKAYVGNGAVEPLRWLPIEASKRNAELFHFFLQKLSPYISSIDGAEPPMSFMDQWMPFMIQSPLVVYITILSSSYFQAVSRQIDVEKSVDAVAARVKLITLINAHITSHSKGVNDETIAAVMSLAYNELIYSDRKSTVAHLKGLREMIRIRGGLQQIPLSTLRMMLIRTDYQVACTFECDPIIQGLQESVPILDFYPIELDSPLLLSDSRFVDEAKILNISVAAATILDDMRFVTTSLLSLGNDQEAELAKSKFLTTVKWIHDRLVPTDPHLADDFIYKTCRVAGIIYTSAMLSRTPLYTACTPEFLQQLWQVLWRVPLGRWKRIPGIFFWVLLVVNPFSRNRPEGRFVKGMIAAGTMAIGLVDWQTVVAMFKGFLAVQRWLGGRESDMQPVANDRLAVSRAPDGGLPAWSLSQ